MFITIIYTIFRTGSHTPADRFGLFFRCGRFISLFRCGFDPLQVNLYLSCIVIVSVLYLRSSFRTCLLFFSNCSLLEEICSVLFVIFLCSFLCSDRLFRIVRCSPLFVLLILFFVLCFFFLASRTHFLSIRCLSPPPSSALLSSFLSLEPTSCLFAAQHQLLPPLFFLLSWVSNLLPINSLPITNSFLRSSFFFSSFLTSATSYCDLSPPPSPGPFPVHLLQRRWGRCKILGASRRLLPKGATELSLFNNASVIVIYNCHVSVMLKQSSNDEKQTNKFSSITKKKLFEFLINE